MTRRNTIIRYGWLYCYLVTLWASSETFTRIQASSTTTPQQQTDRVTVGSKRRHSSNSSSRRCYDKKKQPVVIATTSMIDAALLQTRGGFFRRRRKVGGEADDDEETGSSSALTTPMEQAAELRKQGKSNHDEGKFEEAAQLFHQAANLLEPLLLSSPSSSSSSSSSQQDQKQKESDNRDDEVEAEEGNGDDGDYLASLRDAWSTCRLHESLCCLKAEDYEGCVEACTSLLEGDYPPPAMIRARAFHRRAKAKEALDDVDGAIDDARNAAMFGDEKGVAYYGKLLRETGSSSGFGAGGGGGGLGDLASMFSNPGTAGADNNDMSSLFGSLLGKSSPFSGPDSDAGGDGGATDFLTSSLLGSLGGGLPSQGGKGRGGSLAKSVLSSLSKKLEDESTHDGICRYLQSTSPTQVESMANMAGLPLSSSTATKLVDFAHGVTPKTIRRTVKLTKRGLWGIQLVRKIVALLSKYRHLVFLVFLLQWTKSAVFRPIPVPKVKAPKVKGGGAAAAAAGTGQTAPKPVQRTNAGGPTPGAANQQQQPLLLNRAGGGGLAALAADQ